MPNLCGNSISTASSERCPRRLLRPAGPSPAPAALAAQHPRGLRPHHGPPKGAIKNPHGAGTTVPLAGPAGLPADPLEGASPLPTACSGGSPPEYQLTRRGGQSGSGGRSASIWLRNDGQQQALPLFCSPGASKRLARRPNSENCDCGDRRAGLSSGNVHRMPCLSAAVPDVHQMPCQQACLGKPASLNSCLNCTDKCRTLKED